MITQNQGQDNGREYDQLFHLLSFIGI